MMIFLIPLILSLAILADVTSRTTYSAWAIFPCPPYGTYLRCIRSWRFFDLHIMPQWASAGSPSLFRLQCSWGLSSYGLRISLGNLSIGKIISRRPRP